MHSKLLLLLTAVPTLLASPSPVKRSGFSSGQPIDDNGRGAPILGEDINLPCTIMDLLTTLY
jgi:hypothetical protein